MIVIKFVLMILFFLNIGIGLANIIKASTQERSDTIALLVTGLINFGVAGFVLQVYLTQ